MRRWMAEISYLTKREPMAVMFEELDELHNIIELGPDWNEIDKITVTLNRATLRPRAEHVADRA